MLMEGAERLEIRALRHFFLQKCAEYENYIIFADKSVKIFP